MSEGEKLVPKLRFPEFQGAEGWMTKRLGLALKFQAGFPFPSAGFNATDKGLRLIRNRDLRSNDLVVFYSGDFNPDFVVNTDDVLVGMDGDFTPTVWKNGKALLNQRVGRILPREHNNQRFLLYLLALCLKGMEEATARTTVKHLAHSAVEEKLEPMPLLAEQRKIADCLSSLDELIAAQASKVDALKAHKKGLMQQLFPREGETRPRLRFPPFRKRGAWTEVVAGDIFSNRVERGDAALPIYSVTMFDGMVPRKSLDRRIDDIAESSANKKVCKGDIAYNMMRMWQGAMGIATKDCMVSPAYIVLRPKSADTQFFYYLLKQPHMLRVLTAHSRGLTEDRLRLYYDGFSKIPLLYPSPEEQSHIAGLLTSIDKLVAIQEQELDTLKTHKKGLMQQLFPSAEAIEA